MKLSISWIFDHLEADIKSYDVEEIVKKFNNYVAEIDSFYKWDFDSSIFFLFEIESIDDKATAFCNELNLKIEFSLRSDLIIGQNYLATKKNDIFSWSTLFELNCSKDGLVPALHDDNLDWKKHIEISDYILEVDNKSITHRPDLWGHRGIAREIGSFLKIKLKDESDFLENVHIERELKEYKNTASIPFNIEIKTDKCNKIAASYCKNVENRPSSIFYALRLARIDLRPISSIIDITNYVMLDLGHPMHAFDAQNLKGKLIIENSKNGQKLQLLDDSIINLTDNDIILKDENSILGLAGIMGGKNSGISNLTKDILIEAAHFDAMTIRTSATTHKLRTESSTRFEKTLDFMQNEKAVLRYLFLMKSMGLIKDHSHLISLGKVPNETIITICHDFIESKLGTIISSESIISLLSSIDFKIKTEFVSEKIWYTILVPSFRASKDVSIKEDITEEIGRLIGYESIETKLPFFESKIKENKKVYNKRLLKNLMAFLANSKEIDSYSLYDNVWIEEIQWKIENPIKIIQPLSKDRDIAVTSLVPQMLKNISENRMQNDQLRFFEYSKTYNKKNDESIEEKSSLCAGFYDKNELDFYEIKNIFESIFLAFGLKNIIWKKSELNFQWSHKYQTADAFYDGNYLATIGKIKESLKAKLFQANIIITEINADFFENLDSIHNKFETISKYPSTSLDISMLIAESITIFEIENSIKKTDLKIYDLKVLDIFKKIDWINQKAITIRFFIKDENKTLEKTEIENCYSSVISNLIKIGAQIR